MGTDLLSAAREYVTTKAAQGVVSISPIGLARLLDVDEWTATRLLAEIQRDDHLVKVGGFVYCESCGEATRLDGGTIDSIKTSAIALVGRPCAYCGIDFPRSDRIEVRLSFFCSAAARAAGTVLAGRSHPPETSSPLTIHDLDKFTIILGDQHVINADEKSNVAINSQVGITTAGDFAGQQLNKAGGDQQVSNAPAAAKSVAPVPLLKNYKVWVAAITAVAAVLVAIIQLKGTKPSTATSATTAAPSAPAQKP